MQSISHESFSKPELSCIEVADFSSSCRLCITSNEPDKMTPLFFDPDRLISSKITKIIPVQVQEGDGLPTSICNTCVSKLNLAHEFIEKSLAADKLLRKALQQKLDAKEVEVGVSSETVSPGAEHVAVNHKPASSTNKPIVSNRRTITIKCRPITSLRQPFVSKRMLITTKDKRTISKVISCVSKDETTATEDNHSVGPPPKQPADPVRPKGVKCETCGKWLKSAAVLRNHVKLHKGKQSSSRSPKPSVDSARPNGLKCDPCGKYFRCRSVLRDHMNNHTGERPYKCSKCDKAYPRQDTLTAHERLHAETVARFECNICGERTLSAIRLRNHMAMHSDLRPFPCSICGKGFKRKTGLRDHMRSHVVGKPFLCNICGKRFKGEKTCAAHEAAHGRPPPPRQERKFQCHLCGKALRYKHTLETHEARHRGVEGTFECSHCSKRFMDRDGVKRHIMVNHNEERPHLCPVCARPFKFASYVKKHMRKVHSIINSTTALTV